jgi:hypothetical protein
MRARCNGPALPNDEPRPDASRDCRQPVATFLRNRCIHLGGAAATVDAQPWATSGIASRTPNPGQPVALHREPPTLDSQWHCIV